MDKGIKNYKVGAKKKNFPVSKLWWEQGQNIKRLS